MEKISKQHNWFQHFVAACGYSASGFKLAMGETAFLQEFVVLILLIPATWYFLGLIRAIIIVGGWLLVMLTELLNTAIEAVVDLASPEYHILAKRAKDIASFAVTTSIIINILIWIAVLYY